MACLGKKFYLFLVLLVVFIFRNANFSGSEFDPLRQQWEQFSSNNKYYNEYIVPLHKSIEATVTPQISKTNAAILDKYQVYLSSHVNSLSQKISTHDNFLQVRSKVEPYIALASEKINHYNQLLVSKSAIAIVKLQSLASDSIVLGKKYYVIAVNNAAPYATRLVELYRSDVVPFAHSSKDKIIDLSIKSFHKTVEFSIKSYNYALAFYDAKVQPFVQAKIQPFVQTKIIPPVQSAYNQYLKTYVDLIYVNLVKYYNIFRVESALALSKNLITGTYDQASTYFNNAYQSFKKDSSPEVVEAIKAVETTETTETTDLSETIEASATESSALESSESKNTKEVQPQVDENGEIIVSLTQEIDNWKDFIYAKVENFNENFDNDVLKLETSFLDELKPKVTKLLQNFTKTLTDDYSSINKDIYSIDSKPYLLESGEAVEIDSHDNILDKKITREDFRAKLNGKKEYPSNNSDYIHNYTLSHLKDLETLVDQERKTIVDIYEEFAEVAINEFSKKMMYSTYANSFQNLKDDENSDNYNDWKEYIKVKNYIIEQREALINKRQELNATKRYISEIQSTLKTIVHEAGSYYAILRAKANIEFQTREQREREEESRLDEQEEPTATSTVLKYVTLTRGEEVETKEVELEEIKDEEISDLESDDDDYEVESVEQENGEQVVLKNEVTPEVETESDEEVHETKQVEAEADTSETTEAEKSTEAVEPIEGAEADETAQVEEVVEAEEVIETEAEDTIEVAIAEVEETTETVDTETSETVEAETVEAETEAETIKEKITEKTTEETTEVEVETPTSKDTQASSAVEEDIVEHQKDESIVKTQETDIVQHKPDDEQEETA